MLLQSGAGVVDVFPAIPEAWKEVSFSKLRAEGAFLVSARFSAGSTQFVAIESLAGSPLKARLRMQGSLLASPSTVELVNERDDVYAIEGLAAGETVLIYRATQNGLQQEGASEMVIAPVPHNTSQCNFWGKH
eukprot:5453371-Pyramimonas_sp.AAC.1